KSARPDQQEVVVYHRGMTQIRPPRPTLPTTANLFRGWRFVIEVGCKSVCSAQLNQTLLPVLS
ncbi:MAG TPA: hypothetical protein PLK74_01160, partial [Anaerolineaceae bacterium]|nr:hypothetical protein [Anaerolineaceae bacterium]HOQ68530.1 hypothetical protein [Anaerolineaceae bacterium]